jgi:hypothetical protein
VKAVNQHWPAGEGTVVTPSESELQRLANRGKLGCIAVLVEGVFLRPTGRVGVGEDTRERGIVLSVTLRTPTTPVDNGDVGEGRRKPDRPAGISFGIGSEDVSVLDAPAVVIIAPTSDVFIRENVTE